MKHPSLIAIFKQSFQIYLKTFLFFLPFLAIHGYLLYIQPFGLIDFKNVSVEKISDLYNIIPLFLKLIPYILGSALINVILFCGIYQKFYFNELNYLAVIKKAFLRFFPYLIGQLLLLSVFAIIGASIYFAVPYITFVGGLLLAIFVVCEFLCYSVVPILIISEKKDPWTALKQSRALVRGYRLELFLLFFFFSLGISVLGYIFNQIVMTFISSLLMNAILVVEFNSLTTLNSYKKQLIEQKMSHNPYKSS